MLRPLNPANCEIMLAGGIDPACGWCFGRDGAVDDGFGFRSNALAGLRARSTANFTFPTTLAVDVEAQRSPFDVQV